MERTHTPKHRLNDAWQLCLGDHLALTELFRCDALYQLLQKSANGLTAYYRNQCTNQHQHRGQCPHIQGEGAGICAHLPWVGRVHPVDDLVRILGYDVMSFSVSSHMRASHCPRTRPKDTCSPVVRFRGGRPHA